MATSDLQGSLLNAIDYLVNNRIDKINKDVTLTATIKKCTNSLTGEYQINYNGGFLTAYAQEDTSYSDNQLVYVLVPENDWSKRKLIIGKASQVTEDNNITFVSSLVGDYNMIGQNTVVDNDGVLPKGLHSYLSSEYILLYQRSDKEHSILTFNENEFSNYIKDAEALLIEASFMTRLPRAHRLAKNGKYGIQFVLAFKNQDRPEETKYVSYALDSNNMTGNPFLYNSYTDQYAIFPIDTANYLYVDSIMIWSEGFVTESDTVQADFWGADILVKEPEIYGLRQITATNGDYTLRISTPQGATFTTFEQTEVLTALGTVTYQNTSDISNSTGYYWFVKDDRIDASSEEYSIYGGSGWRYLKDKGGNREFSTTGYENRAYENIYMLAAVYKEQVILKEEFTFYNEAASRNITIESNLGTTFSFDRGTPILTCLIDGQSSNFDPDYPDKYFSFSWSKIDSLSGTTPLNVTYEDLERQYNEAVAGGADYSTIAAIRNNMIAMEGVKFNRNTLEYPVSQIAENATFSCSVYLKETSTSESFFIGSATITLLNEAVASPTDYYILIENGDQVFQYSESGVAPTSERYQDPQEVLPLECHFFDPAGLEVNKDTYSVKWKVPLENTLITAPRESMATNPANEKAEWYTQEIYPLDIEDSYDYQATTNQVTCIVTYQGIEYQKDSDLFFTKVGENGTNGTDVVCKISPVQEPSHGGLLAIETKGNGSPVWNTGRGIGTSALQFKGYNRTEPLNLSKITWSISGGNSTVQSRYLTINANSGIISYANRKSGHRNQIVRGQVDFEGQRYYAFYPIPIIDYNSNTKYKVIINKTWTLKSITYNADGRNPLYNKNQGLFFSLSDGARNKYVVFDVMGGLKDNSSTAAISLSFEKDAYTQTKSVRGTKINDDGLYYVYITPDDVYDGAWSNNIVRARIYGSQSEVGQNPQATVYMPIYMSLNTFGLASLNAWDGNHVEINNDQNYILAPQIGAGIKNGNNAFTGVVMGTAQTYDQTEAQVGLLGYSKGKQSIFLDAETGNAIFGLPENQASTNNEYVEGRIELIPGGDSKIGMWNIGSHALFNINKGYTNDDMSRPIGVDYTKINPYNKIPNYEDKDYEVNGAQIGIPHDAQGVILNANPAYASFKSLPLTRNNSNIAFDEANTVLKEGDSLEVEIDPSKTSIFSIFRHTQYDGSKKTHWHRYPLVGINANGQFYTNAIEDGESTMGIGQIGAFGSGASDNKWVGAQFAYQTSNIFKFFVPSSSSSGSVETRPLYITAGTRVKGAGANEYPREFNIYGKKINLYSSEVASNSTSSGHWLKMGDSVSSFGHTNNYIQIPSASGSSNNSFEIRTQARANLQFTGSSTTLSNKNGFTFNTKTFTSTINSGGSGNQAVTINVTGLVTVRNFRDLTLQSSLSSDSNKNFSLTIRQSGPQMRMGNNNTWLTLNDASASQLYGKAGITIQSNTGGINIRSNRASDGIKIDAVPTDGVTSQGYPYLHLTPQTGGNGNFVLSSGHGTVRSMNDVGGNRAGIQITPGLSSGWAIFSGKLSGTNASIVTNYDVSCGGWVGGGNFNFNSVKSWKCLGEYRSSQSLESHLGTIYALIQQAYDRADDARTRAINAQNSANNAYSHADAVGSNVQGWANNRFSLLGHGHSNYVTNSTFNNHYHNTVVGTGYQFVTAYGFTTIDGERVVNSLTTANGNGQRTSTPI